MNLAVSRIGLQLSNVSNVRHLSHCLKGHLTRFATNGNSVIILRNKSTRSNLLYENRKHWFVPKKETIGAYGWFLLSLPVFSFCLGCWQIERRKWKLNLIKELETRTTAVPVPLPDDFEKLQTMEYQPVTVRGQFLHDQEFIIGPRSLIIDGAPASGEGGGLLTPGNVRTGFMVITPFKLEGKDETILINRGWVPLKKRYPEKRPNDKVNGVVEITGIVRLNEARPQFSPRNNPKDGAWYYRDLNAMAELADTEPIYLDLVTNLGTEDGPIPKQTRVTMRNEHMSYVFTWFTLSLMTGLMWHRMFIRKLPLI
ncbi:surfeit locus protein 1 [Neodiprion fabricii]|uniref:surfeit locus protein 1 n=1 Tax=Neodiprion fabricii TaxID=2872261 RepID=UPI001ED903CC|nr:surfeit locus protein 1 [Neodiprion fabricii]